MSPQSCSAIGGLTVNEFNRGAVTAKMEANMQATREIQKQEKRNNEENSRTRKHQHWKIYCKHAANEQMLQLKNATTRIMQNPSK